MEIPARDYYRYLFLCGNSREEIEEQFRRALLVLPSDSVSYYDRQQRWAVSCFGAGGYTVQTAVRRAKMHDMYAAHNGRPAGSPCHIAFTISNKEHLRRPVEALLVADFRPAEIADALYLSVTHVQEITVESIDAYRRYFFDPNILMMQDRRYLAMRVEWVRIGMLGLRKELLAHIIGLRYRTKGSYTELAYDTAQLAWLAMLEAMPFRPDREGVKALATFLGTIKTLDRSSKIPDAENLLGIGIEKLYETPLEVF